MGHVDSPIVGPREQFEEMMRRFSELTNAVRRLEGLVEDQRHELQMQNSSRFEGDS
jgi:hypothetical protein